MFELKNRSSGLDQKLREQKEHVELLQKNSSGEVTQLRSEMNQTLKEHLELLQKNSSAAVDELKNKMNQRLKEHVELLQENSSGEIIHLRTEMFELKNQSSDLDQRLKEQKEHLEICRRTAQYVLLSEPQKHSPLHLFFSAVTLRIQTPASFTNT
ncbi:hypothetical protein WMY93_033368 [Mugilogobius chulae]|uniref:Uncharacterized protein n=1 Tax=Mugilogobius chulae TaxID=88201 RepID=A0AAW0MNU1_9GOBI